MDNASMFITDLYRLDALRRAALLDKPASAAFDRITRLVAHLLQVPVALVSLLDHDRQYFKGCIGLPEPWASRREMPLSYSLCQHTIIRDEPLIISDAREHPLVWNNHAVREFGVVAYAGVPLITTDGYRLGTLCAIDYQPHLWSTEAMACLVDLAAGVMTEIELIAARQLAEQQARAAEQARREKEALLERISDVFFALDSEGRVTYLNQRAEEFCWEPRTRVLGVHLSAAAPELASPRFLQTVQRAIAGQHAAQFEEYYPESDCWVEVHLHPSPEGVSVYIHNINMRKQVEEALRMAQAEAALLLDSITDGVFVLDASWRLTYVNRAAEPLLGRTGKALVGRCLWEELAQRFDSPVRQAYQRAVAENATITVEHYVADSARWYEMRAYPARVGLLVYARDITSHKQMVAGGVPMLLHP